MTKKKTEPKPEKKAMPEKVTKKKAEPKKVKIVPKYKCYRCGYQTDKRADDRVCPDCGGRVQ